MSTYAHMFLSILKYRHQGHPTVQELNEFIIRKKAARLISGEYPQ